MSTAEARVFQDEQIEFERPEQIDKEATRYLFCAGDTIPARRKTERKEFRDGGEELASRCLVRTKGFLRRCRVTPLEVGADFQPKDLLPDGQETIATVIDESATRWDTSLVGVPVYPGYEIASLTSPQISDDGVGRGIVEITPLRKQPWDDKEMLKLQRFFFGPQYPVLPATLREIEILIRKARAAAKDDDIKDIGDEMLTSCEQFRAWGSGFIEREHNLLKIGVTPGGFVYRTNPVAEVLYDQLEIERIDEHLRNQHRAQADMGAAIIQAVEKMGAQQPNFDFEGLMLKMQEKNAEIAERVARSVISEFQTQQQPADNKSK